MQEGKPFPRSLPCITCSLCLCRGIGLSEWTNTPAVLTTVLCTRSPSIPHRLSCAYPDKRLVPLSWAPPWPMPRRRLNRDQHRYATSTFNW